MNRDIFIKPIYAKDDHNFDASSSYLVKRYAFSMSLFFALISESSEPEDLINALFLRISEFIFGVKDSGKSCDSFFSWPLFRTFSSLGTLLLKCLVDLTTWKTPLLWCRLLNLLGFNGGRTASDSYLFGSGLRLALTGLFAISKYTGSVKSSSLRAKSCWTSL